MERAKPLTVPVDIDYPVSRNGFMGIAAGLGIAASVLISHAHDISLPDENVDRVVKTAAGIAGLAVAVLVTGFEWSNRAERQGALAAIEPTPTESLLADFTEESPPTA